MKSIEDWAWEYLRRYNMAISNAFKGAYTNEVSQELKTVNTVERGIKAIGMAGALGASAGMASAGGTSILGGKLGKILQSFGGSAVANTVSQKAESAQEIQETKQMLSKEDVSAMLGDNPINRSAQKMLSTVYDKLTEAKQQGMLNKKGQIESSLGEIDPASELGKKILTEGK